MSENNIYLETIVNIITGHNYNKHNKNEAQNFNQELYNHLHCSYDNKIENNDADISETKQQYFNSLTQEEIEQQKKDLEELKELYKKENSTTEYRNKLNKYLEKYVYSKRKWEDFRESEVKHDIGHNLRLEYLVENILNEVDEIDEQFKKDAITFAVMHDITHRGSPDFTDHESSIQFITFIKKIGSDINYSQNILADKDKENIQAEDEEKNIQYSNIISSLVSLGDCIDFGRYNEINLEILEKRKSRVLDLVGNFNIDKDIVEELINESITLTVEMEKQFNDHNIIQNAEQILQSDLRENFELITDKIPNSKTIEEFLQYYILYQYNSKPQTNLQTKGSFDAIKELRDENICFLLKGCELLNKSIQKKIIAENGKIHNVYELIIKNPNTEQEIKYTILENPNKNIKFQIFKTNIETKIENLNDLNKCEKLNKDNCIELFQIISTNLIEKEKQFQLSRLQRLNKFIYRLFDEDLAKQIKEELEKSINILFDDNIDIEEKFEAKEKLASLLKLIKTSYKKDKEFTDHYLMLTGICNSKTPEELKKELQYLYHVAIPRTYYKERVKENPLIPTEKNVIFRGLKIDPSKITKDSFKTIDPLGFKMFDIYHGRKDNNEKYDNRKIGSTNTRGNITSFATDSSISLDGYTKDEGGVLFVFGVSEERKEILGMVQGGNLNEEVNTYKPEAQDVAFVLKLKNGKVFDIIFNDDFNGEFYINNELVSQNILKEKIFEADKDESLSEFLNNKFNTKKIIEKKEIEQNRNELKDKFFQDIIKDNIDSIENLNKINELIYIYHNTKNTEQNYEILVNDKFNEKLLDNDAYRDVTFKAYIQLNNINKLLENYSSYTELQRDEIDSMVLNLNSSNLEYCNKLTNIKINLNLVPIYDKILIKNMLLSNNCNKYVLSKFDSQTLKETIENEYEQIVGNPTTSSDVLITVFDITGSYMFEKLYIENILKHNNFNTNVLVKLINIISKEWLENGGIEIILKNYECNEQDILNIIDKLGGINNLNNNNIQRILSCKYESKTYSEQLFNIINKNFGKEWFNNLENLNIFLNSDNLNKKTVINIINVIDVGLLNNDSISNKIYNKKFLDYNTISCLINKLSTDFILKDNIFNKIVENISKVNKNMSILKLLEILKGKELDNKYFPLLKQYMISDKNISIFLQYLLNFKNGKDWIFDSNNIQDLIDIIRGKYPINTLIFFNELYKIEPNYTKKYLNPDNLNKIFTVFNNIEYISTLKNMVSILSKTNIFNDWLINHNGIKIICEKCRAECYWDSHFNKFLNEICKISGGKEWLLNPENTYMILNKKNYNSNYIEYMANDLQWISKNSDKIKFLHFFMENKCKPIDNIENIVLSVIRSQGAILIPEILDKIFDKYNNISLNDIKYIIEVSCAEPNFNGSNYLLDKNLITSAIAKYTSNETNLDITKIKDIINSNNQLDNILNELVTNLSNYKNKDEFNNKLYEKLKEIEEYIYNIKEKVKLQQLSDTDNDISNVFDKDKLINKFEYAENENKEIEITLELNNNIFKDINNNIIITFKKKEDILNINKKEFENEIEKNGLEKTLNKYCKNTGHIEIKEKTEKTVNVLNLNDFIKKFDKKITICKSL